MPFNTLTFLFYFAIVLGAYQATRGWRTKKFLLLCFSQLFYAAWDPPLVVLLWITTVVNWWLARLISVERIDVRRKAYLLLSLTVSLGLLGYFKYGAFVLVNFVAMLSALGIHFQPAPFDVVLPIGISFFTFHALSYTIDVYRRQTTPTSLWDFSLYMSFFPQLVAGPIVRATHFLPQLLEDRRATRDQMGRGLTLIIFGLFQKTVFADSVFAPVADQLYLDPGAVSAWDAWAGILAFSGQIFCDFSGYSTCAIGLALCFGFHFPENFRAPYGAVGFSDFWRRWHISLSSWLRDYVYIPLGGNRGSALQVSRNLLVTMLLGGIWHGASWMFLLWGALHGSYLLIERACLPYGRRFRRYFSNAGLALATFFIVTLTWIPFRAADANAASGVLKALFRTGFPELPPGTLLASLACSLGMVFLHIGEQNRSLGGGFFGMSRWTQAIVLGLCSIGIFLVSGGEPRGFIYFQF